MSQERLRDRRDLLGRFALAEDDLGKALPYRPVVVDLGEVQVLERQVSKLGDGGVDAEPAVPDPAQ